MAISKEDVVEYLKGITLLEASELVKELEEVFGVSAAAAAAPVMVASAAAGGGDAEVEQDAFDVIITAAGQSKINVIKVVREVVAGLGLKEAKELVDSAPKAIREGVSKAEADEIMTKLTEAGATVELK